MLKKTLAIVMIISFLAATMGCAEWSRTQKGAAIGAGAGAADGAAWLDGKRLDDPVVRDFD